MRVRVSRESNTAGLIGKLARNRAALERDIPGRLAAEARTRAPIRTGELRGSIRVSGGTVTVGAAHGVYVDRGTRSTAARPFWRQAVIIAGQELRDRTKGMLS